MNPEEATALCRLAKAAWPSMPMDDFTYDAWALALEQERFIDAKEALRQLMREQQWLHVSDVVKRVKQIRRNRADSYGPFPTPPHEIGADPDAYSRWYREVARQRGDGTYVQPVAELEPAVGPPDRPAIDFGRVFKSVDH